MLHTFRLYIVILYYIFACWLKYVRAQRKHKSQQICEQNKHKINIKLSKAITTKVHIYKQIYASIQTIT